MLVPLQPVNEACDSNCRRTLGKEGNVCSSLFCATASYFVAVALSHTMQNAYKVATETQCLNRGYGSGLTEVPQ